MALSDEDLVTALGDPTWCRSRLSEDFPGQDWSHAAAIIAACATDKLKESHDGRKFVDKAMLGRFRNVIRTRSAADGWLAPAPFLVIVLAPKLREYLPLVGPAGRECTYEPALAEALLVSSETQHELIIAATDERWPLDATLWAFEVAGLLPETWAYGALDIHDAAFPFGPETVLAWRSTGLEAATVAKLIMAGHTCAEFAPFAEANVPAPVAATAILAGLSAAETSEILRWPNGLRRIETLAALRNG